MFKKSGKILILITISLALYSCVEKISITGAGSSFLHPALNNWAHIYKKTHSVNVNYQSIGSGGGISQFLKKTITFAGTDRSIPDKYLEANPDILHMPLVIGGVVIAYNLQDKSKSKLKLTPGVLSDIFLGNIVKWNDKKIQDINPDLYLPEKKIVVVHRSDGSGTTYVFTKYMSDISQEWKEKVGTGTSVNWPIGIGARGNEGVAGTIKNLPFTIGYIELSYAKLENISYAKLQNKSGKFIEASLDTFSKAVHIPNNINKNRFFFSFVNTPEVEGYPITAFAYVAIRKDYKEKNCLKIQEMVKFFRWCNSKEAQEYIEKLDYAKLPLSVIKINLEILDSITCNNKRLND